jgi:hypothetical protein
LRTYLRPHAASLPNGAGWMFEADIFFVVFVVCMTENGVKLMVSLMHTGKDELTPSAPVPVLGQFRNVGPFVEGEPLENGVIVYLADLLPGGCYDGLRARRATDASGGRQSLN